MHPTARRVSTQLDSVFTAVDAWFDRPADERTFRPRPDAWTIDEILEHITLTSHFLLRIIRKGVDKAIRRAAAMESLPPPGDLDRLERIAADRTMHWRHPEHMTPTGTADMAAVRATMREQHAECRALLERMSEGEGAAHTVRMSVGDLGKIDMYQWLFFLGQHIARHLQQMEGNAEAWRER